MYAKYLILKIYMFRQCSYVMEIQKRCLQKFMYLMYLTYEKLKKKNKTKQNILSCKKWNISFDIIAKAFRKPKSFWNFIKF